MGPDAVPFSRAIPHGAQGALGQHVRGGKGTALVCCGPTGECHQHSPGSGGRWDAEHRGALRPDHHSGGHGLDPEFPSPHLGSGCSPVPGDFVLLPGQLLLLVGVSGLVFRGAARPPLYSLARADPRAGAQRNCQLISVCAAAQSSHPAKRWASWKPLPGPVPSR